MKNFYAALVMVSSLLLIGCNGSSGSNDTTTPVTPIATNLTLSVQDAQGNAQQSFNIDESITLVATLSDQNGTIMTGRVITFTAQLGSLSTTTKLTDANGQAIVTITNGESVVGAGVISATVSGLAAESNYEYINNTAVELPDTLSAEMRLDGNLVNQFKGDQQVQVVAQLQNENGEPVVGEIISFTADKGTLNTTTALTNAQGQATVTLSGLDSTGNDDIGAGVLVASHSESTDIMPHRINYEVIASDAVVVNDEVRIGYFDGDTFNEGEIGLSISGNEISAGGTLGLTIDLINSEGVRISDATQVTFTSNCVQSSSATVDTNVFSIRGTAKATYEDISCAGISGTDDVLVASIVVNGVTKLASETISITGEELGSIEFISAEPTSIVLQGTGGQGKQETSTLTFQVNSDLGNPLAQQEVTFELDTNVGGMTLTPTTALTNSQGFVTTKVNAGTVPTTVRVTAKAEMTVNNEAINVQTQSDLLSVNTGLPEQSSMTISTSIFNPEAFNINGVTANITAQLADNFNNPVPDGTTVNFTTEGGAIDGSCNTVNGACTVAWSSANPKPDNHRITILATASGHESFFESNGNNTFDNEDGTAIENAGVSAGWSRITSMSSGFVDMSEAWRDDNENSVYDDGERFIDFNNDGSFSAADGKFNGPQCEGDLCGDLKQIHVRKSLIMIMASSSALYSLTDRTSGTVYANNSTGTSNPIAAIADNTATSFRLSVTDTASQTMPQGTTITVTSSVGEIDGVTNVTIGNTLGAPAILDFIISNPLGGDPDVGALTIEITAPSGIQTSVVKDISIQ